MTPACTIHTGDALSVLRGLPDASVHCVVTSPPYWGLRDYGTATWVGGDPSCDHQGQPMRTRAGVNAHTGTGVDVKNAAGREFYLTACGKCGATREDQQLGLEPSPQAYVERMVEVFREVRRVLREDGTCWVNLGDSYAGSWGAQGRQGESGQMAGRKVVAAREKSRISAAQIAAHPHLASHTGSIPAGSGLKPKDLVGIPWRVAFALQADGWWLRQDVIWEKPNPMPESVTDRCTKSHEYLFLLTKSPRYFWDTEAMKEPAIAGNAHDYTGQGWQAPGQTAQTGSRKVRKPAGWDTGPGAHGAFHRAGRAPAVEYAVVPALRRNRRSVWTVATQPYPEAHFATYPPDLIRPCILAGTSARGCCPNCGAPWQRVVSTGQPVSTDGTRADYRPAKASDDPKVKGRSEGWTPNHMRPTATVRWEPDCECAECSVCRRPECPGCRGETGGMAQRMPLPPVPCVVLDPFGGSGTTGQVAMELGRSAVLIELNPEYVALARRRTAVTPGLALA